MSIESGNFILLDTEFTAWENSLRDNWSKEGEYMEIVQLAAIKVIDFNIVDHINLLIKPVLNPKLSKYFTNLTGITNKQLDNDGIRFEQALHKFYNFCDKMDIYSYGNDFNIIKYNMNLYHIDYKKYYYWENKFFDIKPFFNKFKIATNKYTSGSIYKITNQTFDDISIHNALWDVKSILIAIKFLIKKN